MPNFCWRKIWATCRLVEKRCTEKHTNVCNEQQRTELPLGEKCGEREHDSGEFGMTQQPRLARFPRTSIFASKSTSRRQRNNQAGSLQIE